MACVVGGIAYWLCDVAGLESYACQLIGGLAVFLTRILAVKYHICLPILKGSEAKVHFLTEFIRYFAYKITNICPHSFKFLIL